MIKVTVHIELQGETDYTGVMDLYHNQEEFELHLGAQKYDARVRNVTILTGPDQEDAPDEFLDVFDDHFDDLLA